MFRKSRAASDLYLQTRVGDMGIQIAKLHAKIFEKNADVHRRVDDLCDRLDAIEKHLGLGRDTCECCGAAYLATPQGVFRHMGECSEFSALIRGYVDGVRQRRRSAKEGE